MKIITLSDSARFSYVRWQADSVYRKMRDEEYIIYDIGLMPDQIDELLSVPGVTIKKFDDMPTSGEYYNRFDKFSDALLRRDGGKAMITRSAAKKAWIIQNELQETNNKIVYMDADAFFNQSMLQDDIFKIDFNVCVTLRKRQLMPINVLEDPHRWHFKLLNAGVQFFQGDSKPLLSYFDGFKDFLCEMPELSDQGNLNRYLTKHAGINFTEWLKYYTMKINEDILKLYVIPCLYYNRLINVGSKLDGVTIIAHMKGPSKQMFPVTNWKQLQNNFKA